MKIERDGKYLYGYTDNYCYCVYMGIDGKMQYSVFDSKKEHYVPITNAMSQRLNMLAGIY